MVKSPQAAAIHFRGKVDFCHTSCVLDDFFIVLTKLTQRWYYRKTQISQGGDAMKVGIIRCMQTEDYCPGTTDFRMVRERQGAFAGIEEDIEIVGFTNCGGCPGKKSLLRAKELVRRGADTIAFASCIQKGTPIGYPCPFANKMKELMEKNLGGEVQLLDYTH